MNMIEIQDEQPWKDWIASQPHASFLQSWEWGAFQQTQRVAAVRWLDTERTIGAQVLIQRLGRGLTRWYVPRGPVGNSEAASAFVQALTEEAQKQNATLLHVDPAFPIPLETDAAHETRQPRATRIIDLTPPLPDILQQMKPKTRYNIRVSAKHHVRIEHGTTQAHVKTFLALSAEMAKRQDIRLHPERYYFEMVEQLSKHQMCDVVLAYYKQEPICAFLLMKFLRTVTYLHGASSELHRNVMAPYAAHWFVIQQSKEEGFASYDLWGVAPNNVDDHPYAAISRFKEGFGGTYQEYPAAIIQKTSALSFKLYDLYRRFRS